MTNTIKDEECMLPGIRTPEMELPLSSIYVDTTLPSVINTFNLSTCLTLILHVTPAENLLLFRDVMVLGALLPYL